MWIRSQDKKSLMQCASIRLNNIIRFDGSGTIGSEIDVNHTPLGFYESEEEAMKVLDMIQNELETNSMRYHGYRYDLTFQDNVFQMPQTGFSKEG